MFVFFFFAFLFAHELFMVPKSTFARERGLFQCIRIAQAPISFFCWQGSQSTLLYECALPVIYYSQKNAWVNSNIFSDWFHNKFVPAVTRHMKEKGLPVKALLLLDNAPVHPDSASLVSKEGDIKAMFLPTNTTTLVQPMDQGVLEAMKRRYRKAVLQSLLLEDQEGRSIIELCKKINMKDVVYMTAAAWEDVPSLTLAVVVQTHMTG